MLRIGAVLLAAGASRRFGGPNKLLAQVNGAPLVTYPLRALAESEVSSLVVVTGRDQYEIAKAIDAAGVTPRPVLVHNPHFERGLGTSIAAGIAALDQNLDAALILPGDMPNVSSALIHALTERFEAASGEKPVVYAATPGGEQRNPVLWPRRLFQKLIALDGDQGGKALIRSDGGIAVPVANEGAFADIDTGADLEALASRSSLRILD